MSSPTETFESFFSVSWGSADRHRRFLLVGQATPAFTTVGAARVQPLEHQAQLAGIDLDVPPPRRRLGGESAGILERQKRES